MGNKNFRALPKLRDSILAYNAPTELGYLMEMIGEPTRSIVDMEGLQLIKIR